ncbi:MAG: MFS transporter [Eudoraea sp.]|nr:MFS transporter [Eudoraea sp.]
MKSLRLILTNPKYFAPAWVFASLNIWFGTWIIYIPYVKESLEIDKASLGIALFFLSFGVFTIFPIASRIIGYLGVGRTTWWAVVMCSVTAMLPMLAQGYWMLLLGLYLFGAANGLLDIAMNTLVTEIEKKEKQHFMSASHGFFSLGGVIAGLGSFAIPTLNNAALHMGVIVVVVFIINLIFMRQYIDISGIPEKKVPFSFKFFKPLLLIGLVSFIAMGTEGAIIDWSGLYLKEIAMAPEVLFGAGFLAFSVTMTLGRFLGDGISARIGSNAIVMLGIGIALLGFVLVLTGNPYIAIIGFALNGLGYSVIIPELFRIGGKIEGVISAQGIAFIAGTGYTGFLVAPPILGFISEKYTLVSTFSILTICALCILLLMFIIKRKRP